MQAIDFVRISNKQNFVEISIYVKRECKQGSGAGYSVGPHSGRLLLLWSNMKIWIVYFHF